MRNIALSAAAALLFAASNAHAGVNTGKDALVEIRSAYPDLAAETMAEMSARAEALYPKLAAFFGHELRRPIVIDLSDAYSFSTSFPHRNLIGFPRHIVDRNIAVIAHEMTHLFMPDGYSHAIREGIAIYAQDRFGMVGGFPNFGRDLDEMVRARLGEDENPRVHLMETAEDMIRGYNVNRRDRHMAYLVAGSFTRYLLDSVLEGDMARFKRLYASGDYVAETGRTLAEIDAAWRAGIGLKPLPVKL